jgi:O-antigen/teichoic acid export membrane protein
MHALARARRWLGLDASAPARGGRAAILVVGLRVLALGVNILTGLVCAAMLGASGRGVLAALLTGPAFLAGLCCFGLHASLIYRMKEQPEEAGRYFGTSFMLSMLFGSLGIAIGWVAAPLWLHHYDANTLWLGRMLLFGLPLTLASWTMSGAAEAQGWFTFASGTLYLQNFGVLALLALLGMTGWMSPSTAALAYLVPTVPAFVLFLVRIVPRLKPDFRPSAWHAARLMRYGLRLYGVDLLNTFTQFSDQLIAVAFLPAHLVGAYAVAQSVARLPNVVATGVSVVLFPSVAARSHAHVMERVALSYRLVTIVSGAAAIALALAGPSLLLLIYGRSFAPSITPLRILLVATVISNGTAILYQAYAASGRPGFVTLCEVLGLAISLPLMGLLATEDAATGVAVAVLAGALLRAGLATASLGLVLNAGWPRLWPDTSDLRRLTLACAQMLARAAP